MFTQTRSLFLAAIIAIFIYEYSSSEPLRFNFDLKHIDDNQRDELFRFLDINKDKKICETEFKNLFSSLFYSTRHKTSYKDDKIESMILELIGIPKEKGIDKTQFDMIWGEWIVTVLRPRSALIVVDVQNDFMIGSMPVENGTKIVPVINDLMKNFETVVFTYDWHPRNHCSFNESVHDPSIHRPIIDYYNKTRDTLTVGDRVRYAVHSDIIQYLWDRHCVQESEGSQLYHELNQDHIKDKFNVTKGMDPDIDSYSAFADVGGVHDPERRTTLHCDLQSRGITDVYLTGVVYEFCVGSTALDALTLGYRTAFIEDAVHELNTTRQKEMRQNLTDNYSSIITADDVNDMVTAYDRRPQMGYVLAKKIWGTHKHPDPQCQ
ncbi:unnamed protein product [Oppiella nova]|uniref:nicotinamidase n=1 Tax=Oppiella nova TaxID=334625 RepID=A0A7R9MLJ8_9ACAR|nr:unnamed protein product [Oppiella nova]CAG2179213.1 unnamed protein product [Oppiella nova]